MKTRIELDEHIFVAGATRSGKSFLTDMYTSILYQNSNVRVIKLDTKDDTSDRLKKGQTVWGVIPNNEITIVEHFEQVPLCTTKYIIYRPSFEECEIEFYDKFLMWCYTQGNIVIWIDELMSVCNNAMKYPLGLRAVMTRGASKNVVIWGLSQRPSEIPSIILANTTHFFIFRLPLPQDRKKLVDMTGCEEFLDIPEKYHFWYFKDGNEHPVLSTISI